MNVHYSKEIPHAFIADPSELQELVALLENHIGTVSIRAECTDDISRDFETAKELIAYKNPKSKEIRCIYFTARSDDYEKSARIRFLDSRILGILIDLDGPEDVISNLKEKTSDIIAGMRPWYNAMSHINFTIAISIVLWILMTFWIIPFVVDLVMAFRGVPISDYRGEDTSFSVYFRLVMPISTPLALIFVFLYTRFFKRVHKFLFPRAVFTIGQGKSRFEFQQKFQWGVMISFFISLTAGFIIAILQLFVV